MTAYLVLVSGLPRQVFVLRVGQSVVGRSSEGAINLQHLEISRQHCCFLWDGERAEVEDMQSVRGTFVNGGKIVVRTALEPGDTITVGPATLRFGIGEPPAVDDATEEPPAAQSSAQIVVRGQATDRIVIDGELVIGRDPKVDVWLNDPAVSRRHATVKPAAHGGCTVTDLNSTGGSFVNGHRFDTHDCTVGDRLHIGPFSFQYDGHALVRVADTSGGRIDAANLFAAAESGQTILDEVSLHIAPSRFVGIIGPSGAGKSSLLTTLAGMRAPRRGSVRIEGEDVYGPNPPRSFGFVPQEDIVHLELTVSQALRYSAQLRLPAGTPDLEVQKLIVQTMDQLGLREHAAKPISRLSGGQRKRVSVGVELLARPAILFLDEPSSGLDPATEFALMELLRDLADTGCTIVCTTHVMENAYLMDELVVLAGGCRIFQGPAQEAREYFAVPKLTSLYDRLGEKSAIEWRDEFSRRTPQPPEQPVLPKKRDERSPRRAFALPILLRRQFSILQSDRRNFLLLAGQPIVIAALVSWASDDRALILFFAFLATLWFGCSNAAQEIVKEIAIYKRERLVGVGAHAYLSGKFLFLTAVTVVQALLLFGAVSLFERTIGGSVLWQLAALFGTSLAAVGIGSAISALSGSVMQAVMIVPLILIPQILFSGFSVPVRDMRPSVLAVSALMPTFAAQGIMDTSFFWRQRVAAEVNEKYPASISNLRHRGFAKNGVVFENARPAVLGMITHALWAVISYVAAFLALKSRERS